MKFTPRALFLQEVLDLQEAAQDDNARWEYFQLAHLSDDNVFRIENKSRQIAWSFNAAAEAVANAVLFGISSIFQSINLDEAQEKIVYARRVYDNLVIDGLPKITKPDTTTTLGFENGARIISSPGTPQRGKAKMWFYLDEWAHQLHAKENYTASLPIISKGGKVRGASSPMGASGIFWEVFTQKLRKYPGYSRKRTPWWEIYAFSKDVKEAHRIAHTLSTQQRIERFGKDRIKIIQENMPSDDFGQEYETDFIDESTAWITWSEIKAAQDESLICFISQNVNSSISNAKSAIDALAEQVRQEKVENVFSGGYDVGRTRNTSELFLVGHSTTGTYPLRAAITLDNCDYDSQFDVIEYAIYRLRIASLLIDKNGIGNNLAENAAKKWGGKVQGVAFTNPSKAAWAGNVKMRIQQGKTPLPVNREIAYQIHSIKKLITPSKNVVFDTERNEKHHADKFWAWALAIPEGNKTTFDVGFF